MRTLLIAPSPAVTPGGGRAMLSGLLHDCLSDCVDRLDTLHLVPQRVSRARALAGFIDGVTPPALDAIVARIAADGVGRVVIDGSNLGRVAHAVKHAAPTVQVLTFSHNVEARFFKGALAQNRSIHALGVLAGNYVAERLAVRHSDRLIALSERDSLGFERWYGRRATDIFPMALADRLAATPPDCDQPAAADAPALFVGGAFYANQQGIAWFAEHVTPRIGIVTNVVGRGMETMRDQIGQEGRVHVIGEVDDLAPCYAEARVAIAPIFDGSGMKTKVAEALMFGKRIAGTREAFSGYEGVAEQAGWVCDTADDFVAAIAAARAMPIPRFDPALRDIYLRDYSLAAARRRLQSILSR